MKDQREKRLLNNFSGIGQTYTLKVHKIENFFDSDFGICVIFFFSYVKILSFYKKKFVDWAIIGGGTIFPHCLRTTRNEKNFLS
jgi:hypothetical protein